MKLSTHAAVFAIGIATGVGGVAVASGGGDIHKASTSQTLTQLKKVNSKLDILNRSVGGYTSFSGSPSVRAALQRICSNTGSSC